MIRSNPKGAAETYLAVSKEKLTVDEMAQLLTQPGAIFQAAPVRTMVYATYMHKAGFFPIMHNREGS